MITFDFETEAIEGNPIANPPKPVGVAIKIDDKPSEYLAWGHPTGNNCTWRNALIALTGALEHSSALLAHNAAFDLAVLRKWFLIEPPSPLSVHDTQFLVFLHDPYAFSFGLKPSAERILGLPPDEQDELKAWVLANVPEATAKHWGAHISKAPGDLVGKYACGDTDRTYALFQKLMPEIERDGMLAAYQREQRLMPILAESSVRGVRVDLERLNADIETYTVVKEEVEKRVFSVLGEFNVDSDRELAERLEATGQVTDWVMTKTGKRSTSRKNLEGRVKSPELLELLAYRGILATCLGTFAQPWAEAARATGRLHPQWNQVRGDRGDAGDLTGTRTGRMSCREPNLQNIPNDFLSVRTPEGLPKLMEMRKYLLPEEGHVWVKRDFSAQEMRILAHFTEGALFDAFVADPHSDPHDVVQKMVAKVAGVKLSRKDAKITGFGIMYGRGIPALAAALGVSVEEGQKTRNAYFAGLPEVERLSKEVRNRGSRGGFIRTWGGRRYFRELAPRGTWLDPSKGPDEWILTLSGSTATKGTATTITQHGKSEKNAKDFSYKLFNYLIQGSAADQTKQALIDWHAARASGEQLIAAVHDEVNISVPIENVERGMRTLREQMDADRFDVPFRSEGFVGPNWADIEGYKDE